MVLVDIRDAVLADMPVLQEVFRRSSLSNEGDRADLLAHPEVLEYSDEWVRKGHTRVADHAGRIRGFATAVPAEDAVELEDLFVDPEWIRRGIARALIRDVAARARSRSVRRVDVTANVLALDFYRAVGFILDGTTDTRFGQAPRMHLDMR